MKRFLLALLILLIFLFSSHCVDTINITSGEWPPYLGENLNSEGYVSDIIREAFKASGVKVNFGYYPWMRSYIYARDGGSETEVWNATAVWVYTDERSKLFDYSDIVVEDYEVLYSLKSNFIEWEDISDLKGLTIGGTLHTVYPIFDKAVRDGILTLDRHGNYDILFLRLLHRQLDAIPYDKRVGEYFLRTTLSIEDQNKIVSSSKAISKKSYHLIFSKIIPENRVLIKLFNDGLKLIKENGTYLELENRLNTGYYD